MLISIAIVSNKTEQNSTALNLFDEFSLNNGTQIPNEGYYFNRQPETMSTQSS